MKRWIAALALLAAWPAASSADKAQDKKSVATLEKAMKGWLLDLARQKVPKGTPVLDMREGNFPFVNNEQGSDDTWAKPYFESESWAPKSASAKVGKVKCRIDHVSWNAVCYGTITIVWFFDGPDGPEKQPAAEYHLVATASAASTDDGIVWDWVSGQASQAYPDADIKARAQKGEGEKPDLGTHGKDDGKAEVIDLVRKAFTDGTMADLTLPAADVIVLGSGPGELVAGGKKLQAAWKAWAKVAVAGPMRAELSADGKMAMVWANVDVPKHDGKETKDYTIQQRVFLVLERMDEGGWKVVGANVAFW